MSGLEPIAAGHEASVADATPESVGVTVPASSANLGPGFDAFAVALDVALQVWSIPRGPRRVVAEGQGADEIASGDDNLIWRALVAWCRRADAPVPDVSLHTLNDIPLERGMGSSAAAAVAGAALGRALALRGGHGDPGGDQLLLEVAADLEGHPDNAAAAVVGGLVVCHDGRPLRLEPTPGLRPVVCVPVARQATGAARGLLPEHVPLADAAANGARAAIVLAGLAGVIAWDPSALRDVLHEPPRLAAMSASGDLVARLRGAGIGACLSGAGPSVLAILGRGDEAALDAVRARADGFEVRAVDWDRAGAAVCPPGLGAP